MKRILVITKYRFIGDTLIAIPTIRAIKRRWPDSSITVLTGARACELLQNCPYIEHCIEYDPYRPSDKGLAQYLRLLSRLRQENYDLALVLNRSFHSALTATLGGARKRVGWSGFEGRDFLLTDRCVYDREKPEIDCFFDVFRRSSQESEYERHLELWLTASEKWDSASYLPEFRRLIGMQPGATHGYKQWPIENFVHVAECLIGNANDTGIVLIGGAEERPVANAFMSAASNELKERTTDLVGKLSLRLTLGAVSQLNAFVGNDTAIRHAAVALDTPSIGIFGPTSCTKWGNAFPPRHLVVSSTTGKMTDVTSDSILQSVEILPLEPSGHIKGRRSEQNLIGSSVSVEV
jgi:heptosyltransferase II